MYTRGVSEPARHERREALRVSSTLNKTNQVKAHLAGINYIKL
jgi:hypothetical protein